MQKIYIASPSHVATGGTELLQQLCFYLNKLNIESKMYYTEPIHESPIEKKFSEYKNPWVEVIEDVKENILILPETRVDLMYKYRNVDIYIWWLSVDNYYGAGRKKVNNLHKLVYKIKDIRNGGRFLSCKHLVQSEYARLYLTNEKGVKNKNIFYLSDYLNKKYLEKTKLQSELERKDYILYNPKKGIEFTQLLMQNIQEFEWKPLINLSNDEMISLMQMSKVYVDFGNHPGKDRIPREAAMCGCCVITGKRGAANNPQDVKIPEEYKFDENKIEIEEIHNCIKKCMKDYEIKKHDFDKYREKILCEEQEFIKDIRSVFLVKEQ